MSTHSLKARMSVVIAIV